MPVQCLIYARPVGDPQFKSGVGEIITSRDTVKLETWPWSHLNVLPDYIKIEVSDGNESDIDPWMVPLRNDFIYEIVNQNPSNVRYRISVNASLTSFTGAFTQDMIDYVLQEWATSTQQVNLNAGFAVFNIPPANFDEAFIQNELLDLFQITLNSRRYRIKDALLNQVSAAGGFDTRTLAEFNAQILDKLI